MVKDGKDGNNNNNNNKNIKKRIPLSFLLYMIKIIYFIDLVSKQFNQKRHKTVSRSTIRHGTRPFAILPGNLGIHSGSSKSLPSAVFRILKNGF